MVQHAVVWLVSLEYSTCLCCDRFSKWDRLQRVKHSVTLMVTVTWKTQQQRQRGAVILAESASPKHTKSSESLVVCRGN